MGSIRTRSSRAGRSRRRPTRRWSRSSARRTASATGLAQVVRRAGSRCSSTTCSASCAGRRGGPPHPRDRGADDRAQPRGHPPARPPRSQEARAPGALPADRRQVLCHASGTARRCWPASTARGRGRPAHPRPPRPLAHRRALPPARRGPRRPGPIGDAARTEPIKEEEKKKRENHEDPARRLRRRPGLASPVLAADTYQFDKSHTNVGFQVRHIVTMLGGKFRDFSGTIQVDRAKPESSSVEFTIQAASIFTNDAEARRSPAIARLLRRGQPPHHHVQEHVREAQRARTSTRSPGTSPCAASRSR